MDEEKKKGEIVDFLTAKARMKGGQHTDNSIKINGNNNYIAHGDIHINKKEIIRTEFRPGPQHITEAEAYRIRQLVHDLAAVEIDQGAPSRKAHQKWWSALKARYRVTTYKAIPAHLADEAITWLRQQRAIKQTLTDAPTSRTRLYRAIWAQAKAAGLSKGEVYGLALHHLGKRVSSLKQLDEPALTRLYDLILHT